MNKNFKTFLYGIVAFSVIIAVCMTASQFRSKPQMTHGQPKNNNYNNNYKMMGQMESQISDAVGMRMLREAAECDRKGMSTEQRARRVHAIYLAGMAEVHRVRSSNYTVPFNAAVLESAAGQTSSRSQ